MSPIRVLVCGGRDFNNASFLNLALDSLHALRPFSHVISGAARGADTLGEAWAFTRDVAVMRFPADWDRWGNRAGPIRNQQMLDEGKPDLVIAFPGGAGTRDMIRRAREAGIRVWIPKRREA